MPETVDTDVIVVGSGIAGAMCAYMLAKQGVKVLILEAGPEIHRDKVVEEFKHSEQLDLSIGYPNTQWAPRPDSSSDDDDYLNYIEYDYLHGIEYLSGVGGTTWHWGGTAVRMQPADFRMHSQYGRASDWQLSYDDLEPFYSQAEHEMGVSGDNMAGHGGYRSQDFPLPPIPATYAEKYVADRLAPIGLDFISLPSARNSAVYDGRNQCQGFGTCTPICPTGAQYNASVHVNKARRHGARLINNARVDRLFCRPNQSVEELEYSTPDGIKHRAKARIFVLAANAMETPKLLLMSADECHPSGLANSSDQVGKNLFGHPGISSQMLLPTPVYAYRGPQTTLQCIKYQDDPFRKNHAGWMLTVDNALLAHNAHVETVAAIENHKLIPPELDNVIRNRISHSLRLNCMLDQLPSESNYISLDWSDRDTSGQPKINVRWKIRDYEKMGAEEAEKLMKSISIKLGATEFQTAFPIQHHHIMGTTLMGVDAKTSVVNGQCRTHDHDNLYLLSSSVFPTGGSANPTLTIAALSIRAAKSIALDLVPS